MLGYLNRAVPLEKLEALEDFAGGEPHPTGSAAGPESERNRAFALLVRDIRSFALELGLNDTKNYSRYVSIDRDYLALVVSAAAKDSFTPHLWHFPIVGSVPYKGFFNPEGARREAAKLMKKDLDVWVRQVDAFSTLGWFRDPLYSYMRDYPVHRLADLLIHELLHATVYIKDQSQFNEELAEFVGTEGARLYMESRYGAESVEYLSMREEEADSAVFLSCVKELIAELEVVYASELTREEKLLQKAETIAAFLLRFAEEYESRFSTEAYRGFSGMEINNAFLELYRLYYGESHFYRDLYEESGGDLPAFIAAAKQLPRNRKLKDPRAALAKELLPPER